MLRIKDVSKSYTQRGIVLNKLQLDVDEGDTVAITGPSGSGKSTLLNIIGLLERPDTGEVFFKGSAVSGFTEDESAVYRNLNIGFVFQDHMLLPHLTVEENIFLPLLASDFDKMELAAKTKQIRDLMQKTSIRELSDKFPANISGGEAQRVALVRALVCNPSVLLADEPTGSLDVKNAEAMGELLNFLNKETGLTIILATHSPALAARMAKKLRLENGILIEY